jgi:glycosyltransferase involved in cell wall biosynthesis
LFASLIYEFKSKGHNILVSSKAKNSPKTEIVNEGGIQVLRIGGPEFTAVSNNVKKALAYQQYVLKQRYYVKKYWGKEKIDLIISHSLPPELAYVVGGLKKHYHCQFYLIQSDYTWQDAVAYGFFGRNSPIACYYQYWEHKAFKLADYIGVPTYGNVRFAKLQYPWLKEELFSVYPFWQRTMGVEKGKGIKEKYGLQDKFVVMYGGNVGQAQRVEHLVDLAEQVQEYENIVFIILGKGSRLQAIKDMVAEKTLKNVIFKDFLPQQDYLQFLAACDTGLIMLNEEHATPNFPSKTMSYFDLQIPVLAAIDYVTDFGQFLEETGTGLWSYSGDTETFKQNLLTLYLNPEMVASIKERQKAYFEKYMQPEYTYKMIMEQVNRKEE